MIEGARANVRLVEHFAASGGEMLASVSRMGLEGIISKRLDAPYQPGRSESWCKSKSREGQEVVIGGWTTTGKEFRSLLAGIYRDGTLAYVGRIGTGFGRDVVGVILPRLKAVETGNSPFTGRGAPDEGEQRALGAAGACG